MRGQDTPGGRGSQVAEMPTRPNAPSGRGIQTVGVPTVLTHLGGAHAAAVPPRLEFPPSDFALFVPRRCFAPNMHINVTYWQRYRV